MSVRTLVAKETHPQLLQTDPRSLTPLRATAITSTFKPVFFRSRYCVSSYAAFETTPLPSPRMLSCSSTVAVNRDLTVDLKVVALDLLSCC